MKQISFILTILFLLCISANAFAFGEPHHPNWKRYGIVPMPLTSFINNDGTRIVESEAEGAASGPAGKALLSVNSGKPCIMLGAVGLAHDHDNTIITSVPLPPDYWRNGIVKAIADNSVATNVNLKWYFKVSTGSTLATSGVRQADVTATAGTTEELTFTPNVDAEPQTMAEGASVVFEVGRNDTSTQAGKVMRFYEFYFQYEKKTDS